MHNRLTGILSRRAAHVSSLLLVALLGVGTIYAQDQQQDDQTDSQQQVQAESEQSEPDQEEQEQSELEEQEQTQEQEEQEQADQAQTETQDDESTEEEIGAVGDFERFIPTERVSRDLGVSFPADI